MLFDIQEDEILPARLIKAAKKSLLTPNPELRFANYVKNFCKICHTLCCEAHF